MAYGHNQGLNRYLDELFGTGDVFDGQGGFWNALEAKGIDREVADRAISAYGMANDPRTGTGAQQGTPRAAAEDPTTQLQPISDLIPAVMYSADDSPFTFDMPEFKKLRDGYQGQMQGYVDQIGQLRRSLLGTTGASRGPDAGYGDILNARYTQAGRSRRQAGASTSAIGTSGLTF